MSAEIDNINQNNFKKYTIIFCACLIIGIGILVIFFTDYIYNLKNIVKDKSQSIYYFKWIILGFLLNIIFLIALNSMKSYKNNIVGERGPQGFNGRKGGKGEKCVICTGTEDHNYEYELGETFNKDKWKKK